MLNCDIGKLAPGIIFATRSFSIDGQPIISEDDTGVDIFIGKEGIKFGDDVSPICILSKASGGPEENGFIYFIFLRKGICLKYNGIDQL